MLRPTELAAAITTAAVALVGPALVAGPAARAATPDKPVHHSINVRMTNAGFTLPKVTHAGFVTFEVSTKDAGGHQLQGLQLHKGVSQAQIVADIRQAIDKKTAAAGIQATQRDATLVGGAVVEPSSEVEATVPLSQGTYWFFDFTQFFLPHAPTPVFHRLDVKGPFDGGVPLFSAVIDQVETKAGPRFLGPDHLKGGSSYLVRNQADEIHELAFERVNPGVTDKDLTLWFAGKLKKNPFAEAASRGLSAQSPGRFQLLSFHPRAGRYAMLCFIPDDKTGLPHALLGMHRIVALG